MAISPSIEARATSVDWSKLLQSRLLWCIGIIAFLAIRELSQNFGNLLTSLGDTDDATRLYQVRHLMATGAWFDMTLPRLGGDTPLISHWSRLIDLPLLVLLKFFGLFLAPETAEVATRVLWPLLVLLVFLRVLVRAADAQGGPVAAAFVLFFGVTCMAGLFQFRIGRIDHHNGMIMGSIGGLLLLLNARRKPSDGYLAGFLIGIGLGIGYEPLAFLLPALGLMALIAVGNLDWLTGVRNMAVALLATFSIIFLATIAPSVWFSARCDALSLNMVALTAGGAIGLAIVDAHGRSWSLLQRIAVLAASGAAGLLAYGALDPRCLAGPFGQIDSRINAVWLDHVVETKSVFTFFAANPAAVASYMASVALGIYAAFQRWRRLRTPETMLLLGLMLLVTPTGLWMVKLMPYTSWIAVFCTALSIGDLGATTNLTALSRQLVAALLANQWTFAIMAAPVLGAVGIPNATPDSGTGLGDASCMTTPAIRSLAALPKGLFVGSVDFGSYIVALTPHDALAAPYHRIDKAILDDLAILAAAPADAKPMLRKVHADYIVLCLPKLDAKAAATITADTAPPSLEGRLKAGLTIDFLDPIATSGPAELGVWRVRH